jgi:hypothetical protein
MRPALPLDNPVDQRIGNAIFAGEGLLSNASVGIALTNISDSGFGQFYACLPFSARDCFWTSAGVMRCSARKAVRSSSSPVGIATRSPFAHLFTERLSVKRASAFAHLMRIAGMRISQEVRRIHTANAAAIAQVRDKWSFLRRFAIGQDVCDDTRAAVTVTKPEVPTGPLRGLNPPFAPARTKFGAVAGDRPEFVNLGPEPFGSRATDILSGHRETTPLGEPRTVATVPGHSCVHYTCSLRVETA